MSPNVWESSGAQLFVCSQPSPKLGRLFRRIGSARHDESPESLNPDVVAVVLPTNLDSQGLVF
jgi:hypothetical protein